MRGGASDVLVSMIGRVIAAITRILYSVNDTVDSSAGPVEFTFEDGHVVLMDAASDGEALATDTTPWRDPFAGDLEPENRAFVGRAGKWAREDVSATETYASLIGAEVLDVELVQLPGGKVVGAIVQTRGGMVRVEVQADEVYVDVA